MSVNKAILLGNLGKDPEMKYTQSGKAVCNFTLATSEKWKGQDGQKQESTTWHNIQVWGKLAEVMNEYLAKGKQVYIEGRIVNRSYEKDGEKKYISEVVVQNFSFVGNKQDADKPTNGNNSQPPDDDEDLPF